MEETTKIINSFPGYSSVYFDSDKKWHNIYRDTDVGHGGYITGEPGMYGNVALLDIASMHPTSIVCLNAFGEYTKNFEDLMNARLAIKHGDYDAARHMFGGRLAKYLDDENLSKQLSQAIKIPINACYGLTSANYDNPFRDIRNKENIVACRGALFMRTLEDEVKNRGFIVASIRTDSIKIPDATPEIIEFCMGFAKKYGYTFEHEATYERMCLVNKSAYIAKYATPEQCEKLYGYSPGDNKKHGGEWTATAKQFQVPYVFKTLFSKEKIEFKDLCETFEVKTALYLDKNEDLPDVSVEEKEFKKAEEKYKKGLLSDISFEETCKDLNERISIGHNYIFVGKVGLFCPIKEGKGGAILYRKSDDKYDAATGTKGYRWLESAMVQELDKYNDIDMSYYKKLVDEAVEAISQYGDFEWFVSTDPYVPDEKYSLENFMNIPEGAPEEIPFL